jgi:hypothetical protein
MLHVGLPQTVFAGACDRRTRTDLCHCEAGFWVESPNPPKKDRRSGGDPPIRAVPGQEEK